MNRLAAVVRGPDAKRLGACLALGVVLAVMTGPDGSNAAPTSGFHRSIADVRVVWFLLIGLVVWGIGTFATHRQDLVRSAGQGTASLQQQTFGRAGVRWTAYAVILAVLIALPQVISVPYQTNLIGDVGIYVLLALGLNVVVGFAGLLDLGFVAFFAVGAYATAYFTNALPAKPPFVVTPFLCFPIAVVAAVIAGVLLGTPTLRLRGDYLAIVTLGFGEIIFNLANNSPAQTGGGNGVGAGERGGKQTVPHFVFGSYRWSLTQKPYWYLLLGLIVVVILLLARLENSRVGRAWVAIREDEVAAEATGINPLKYKVLAFAIGAAVSGFAGTFYASRQGFFDANKFAYQISLLVLVLVIFGGMGSIWGTITGVVVLEGLQTYLDVDKPSWYKPSDLFMYVGFLLIVMMIFRPQGLIPSRRRARELRLAEEGVGSADAMSAPGGAP